MSLTLRIVFSIATIWLLGIGGGTLYSFGALAPDFKNAGNYTQVEINVIGAAAYIVGLALQLPIGLVSAKFPRVVVVISQSIVALGWAGLAAALKFKPHATALMAVLFSLTGGAVSSSCAPAFFVFCQESPEYATITLHGFFISYAVSGGIEAVLYTYIYPNASSEESGLKHKLTWTFVISAAFNLFVVFVVAVWLFWPRKNEAVPTPTVIPTLPAAQAQETKIPDDETARLLRNPAKDEKKTPLSLREWLVSVVMPMSLYWVILFFSFGVAVNFYNNAGSMALSLGASGKAVSYLFLLFCGGQLFGRVAATLICAPDSPPRNHNLYLVCTSAILCLVSVLAHTIQSKGAMYFFVRFRSFASHLTLQSTVNAVVYGSLWVVIFNLQQPDKAIDYAIQQRTWMHSFHVYGILTLAPACGPIIFDSLSGALYDKYANPDTHLCEGKQCYSQYFVVTASVMGVATILALIVLWVKRNAKVTVSLGAAAGAA